PQRSVGFMRRLAIDSKLLQQGLLRVDDVLSIGDASSKDLQLGRLAQHNVGAAAPTILNALPAVAGRQWAGSILKRSPLRDQGKARHMRGTPLPCRRSQARLRL